MKMTNIVLAETTASVSELKRNPMGTVAAGEGFPVAILNRNEPAFYCVPAKAFEALSQISDNTMIKAIRGGNTIMLSQKDIVVGDILLLATGDKIPADGRLLESVGLTADESALTGESVPAKKNAEFEIADEKTN